MSIDKINKSFFSNIKNSLISKVKNQLVFIDSQVEDYQSLMRGVISNAQVVILNSHEDGVEQITQALEIYSNVETIHIISHGREASLKLGSNSLTAYNLDHYQNQIQNWGTVLVKEANIMLYGCNVAADKLGQAFVRHIGLLTGAAIAASQNLTGSNTLGGDWNLDFVFGKIQTTLAFEEETLAAYRHTLTYSDRYYDEC